MKKQITILGSGFAGSFLRKQLVNDPKLADFSVVNINSKTYGLNYLDTNVLRDTPAFIDMVKKSDYIINCVGYTGRPNVDAVENHKEESWKLNVNFPLLLATECAKYGTVLHNISTGCIFNSDEKVTFFDDSEPNFTIWSDNSSTYSKHKGAFEEVARSVNVPMFNHRIRMPYYDIKDDKNFLCKIHNYNNLMNVENSATDMYDLADFITELIVRDETVACFTPLNVVSGVVSAGMVTEMLKKMGVDRNWKFVNEAALNMKVKRSNCILDSTDYTAYLDFEWRKPEKTIKKYLKTMYGK